MFDAFNGLFEVIALGGPVLVILILLSIISLAIVIVKVMQFRRENVGKHELSTRAIAQLDAGDKAGAELTIQPTQSHLGRLMKLALANPASDQSRQRLESEAEQNFISLESGLRFLDNVAQVAPLLGLFGTVLGMIEAFQALQGAGSQVDPSVLAGGIWVALMTTAAGLAVAMPVSMALAWLEGQLDKDRAMADLILNSVAFPLEGKVEAVLTTAMKQGAQQAIGQAT